MKNVLVLGASGFIGRYLVEKLLPMTDTVVGYSRTALRDVQYPFIEGAFEKENFDRILRDYRIDTVYHLISNTVPANGTEQAAREIQENVVPTVKLLEAMRRVGTQRLVFASSGGTVYGESTGKPHQCTDPLLPLCSYGAQKAVIEQYIRLYHDLYGMKCIIARISNPYGILPQHNRTQGIIPIFLSKLMEGEAITLFGETTRDYIHIDDTVEALCKLGNYVGQESVFNIGTGIPTGLSELIQMLETVVGRKFSKIVKQEIRSCDVRENVLDIQATIRHLQWSPKISLVEGIRKTFYQMKPDDLKS